MELQRQAVAGTADDRELVPHLVGIRIPVLQAVEPLHQPRDDVADFGEGELLCSRRNESLAAGYPTLSGGSLGSGEEEKGRRRTREKKKELTPDAFPRPPAERRIRPIRPPLPLPPLRPELIGVFAPDVLAAVERVGTEHDRLALAHVDAAGSVRPAAAGQRGIFRGRPLVRRHGDVDTVRLVHAVLQVLAVLEALERDPVGRGGVRAGVVGAEVGDDGGAQLVVDVGPAHEHEEEPAQQAGHRVAAGQVDVHGLVAELERVFDRLGQVLEEDEFLAGRVLLEVGRVGGPSQGLLDVVVGEGVHRLAHSGPLGVVVDPVERAGSSAFLHVLHRRLEGLDKVLRVRPSEGFLFLDRGAGDGKELGICAFAKQEIGRDIQRQAVEDSKEIRSLGPPTLARWKPGHHVLHMPFLHGQLRDLCVGELRSQRLSEVLPFFPVRQENARPGQRLWHFDQQIAVDELLKLCREDGLDVLGVDGEDGRSAQPDKVKGCGPHSFKRVLDVVRVSHLIDRLQPGPEDADAERQSAFLTRQGLAPEPAGFASMVTTGRNAPRDQKDEIGNEGQAKT